MKRVWDSVGLAVSIVGLGYLVLWLTGWSGRLTVLAGFAYGRHCGGGLRRLSPALAGARPQPARRGSQ